MTYFIEELVRGSMTSVDDTILRIDSPITPVSTKPDPSPADELPKSRWSLKLITMTAIYLSGGMSLLVYIVFTIYANYFSLEVDSGVVTAPIEKIVSTTDGQITKVSIDMNELVVKGRKMITIEDAKVERYHPLQHKRPFGNWLRYFVCANGKHLGCLLISGAAKTLYHRDQWIGWSSSQRRCNLSWVINNSRYLIFPWVQVPHLASHVLGHLAKRVAQDWEQRWGVSPGTPGNVC